MLYFIDLKELYLGLIKENKKYKNKRRKKQEDLLWEWGTKRENVGRVFFTTKERKRHD